jgi:prepilin-type N-terminal cleavage/methylation domain-containing protein
MWDSCSSNAPGWEPGARTGIDDMKREQRKMPGVGCRTAGTRCGRRAGFTLVEVLVVMVIVALLISAVVGGMGTARQMAWRTRTRETARQIVQAWNLYLNDYREFPLEEKFSNPKPEGGYEMAEKNVALVNADRVYLEVSDLELSEPGQHYRGLRDAWKKPMGFNLDFDYDGKIDNPLYGASTAPEDLKRVSATSIAWSRGANPGVTKKWIVQW